MRTKIFSVLVLMQLSYLAQTSFSFGAGLGLLETFHLSARGQYRYLKAALAVGAVPPAEVFTLSADLYLHLGKDARRSGLPPWFLRSGYTHFLESGYSDGFVNARLGRDFNITRQFGISLDLGLNFLVSHEKRNGWDIYFPIVPAGSLLIFIRLPNQSSSEQ